MNFDTLATGPAAKALGLQPDEGFWLAVTLILLALVLDVLLVKSILDRRVLEKKPAVGATIVLSIVSTLCLLGGVLLLLF
jgi:hypothetical protein